MFISQPWANLEETHIRSWQSTIEDKDGDPLGVSAWSMQSRHPAKNYCWVATLSYPYEGDTVIGVFSSSEKAISAIRSLVEQDEFTTADFAAIETEIL